ncbi:MAG: hypothetical protein VX677_11445, partial [Candidatus Poribacteria bacterium]|nr:hypothetical protein [Candidatus Poribacteria bacterium]
MLKPRYQIEWAYDHGISEVSTSATQTETTLNFIGIGPTIMAFQCYQSLTCTCHSSIKLLAYNST